MKTKTREHVQAVAMIRTSLLALDLLIAMSPQGTAQPAAAAGPQTPVLMDRQREIALALSSCPDFVASKAAVYVLEKSGYVKVRESQNGFTAIVQHALPTSQDPQCMDAEGTRKLLPRMLKVAELRAEGKSPEEIGRFLADALAKGVFQAPTRPGVDYMLSTENLVPNAKGIVVPYPPHVMFYGMNLTNGALGLDGTLGPDGNPVGPAFVAGEGSPYALVIIPTGTHGGSAHASVEVTETTENPRVPVSQESPAVTIARAHVEAWSKHDFDKARKGLAADVHITAMTTQPVMAPTDVTGADKYMDGLIKFASTVVPGSAHVIASVGDERNALLMLTVKTALGPGGSVVTLPAARLYLLDENGKIKVEQVVFYAASRPAAADATPERSLRLTNSSPSQQRKP